MATEVSPLAQTWTGRRSRPARVLVVDEPSFATVLRDALFEHRIEAEADTDRALNRLYAEHFDLVICELFLRPVDGAEFNRRVRLVLPQHARRMIFTAAQSCPEELLQACRSGLPNLILPKPVPVATIGALIVATLRGSLVPAPPGAAP